MRNGTQTTNKFDDGNTFVLFQQRYFLENAPSRSFEKDDEAKLALN